MVALSFDWLNSMVDIFRPNQGGNKSVENFFSGKFPANYGKFPTNYGKFPTISGKLVGNFLPIYFPLGPKNKRQKN